MTLLYLTAGGGPAELAVGDGIAHIAPTLPACPGRYYQGTALHHVASRASPPAPSPLPAVPTHHGPQVAALFSRVQREQGRLDVLVNAAWGGNELPRLQADWGTPSWEVEAAAYWDSMFVAGVRAALVGEQAGRRFIGAAGLG